MDENGLRPEDFRSVEDIAKLPLVDRALVREELERFVSSEFRDERSRGVVHASGSSSGVRRKLYWDNESRLRWLALNERFRSTLLRLAGDSPGRILLRDVVGERRADVLMRKLGGQPLQPTMTVLPGETIRPYSSQWAARTGWQPHQQNQVSVLLPYETVIERMNELRPRLVVSHGSYAEQFFRFLEQTGSEVHLPRAWSYSGDSVSPGGRELAAERGCKLHSTYFAAEAGPIGFQCERCEGHHLNVDLCALRAVDDQGQTVGPGTPGEIVISNLVNRATVLLNYRLDDWGLLDPDRCLCGRSLPLLGRLEGRRSEILTLADGREVSALSLEGLLREELRSTFKVQVGQPRPGELQWRIVAFPDADREALRAALVRKAEQVLGVGTSTIVEFVDEIPSTPAGKFLRVVPR